MSEAYRNGLKEIIRIDPDNGAEFVNELKKLSPEFAEYFVEFELGTIYRRSILEPKLKELIAIATLTAMSYNHSHLKLHILGAIKMGCSKEEIMEVIFLSNSKNDERIGKARYFSTKRAPKPAHAENLKTRIECRE